MRRPDLPTLVAGFALAALGVVVLLVQVGEATLGFGWIAPAACAALGAILLASGLARTRGR